jgi:hypothetical protein
MNGVAPPIGRRTPLNDASWKGHAEVVTLLLAHGADVHAKDDYYGYSLSNAPQRCPVSHGVQQGLRSLSLVHL